MWDVPFGKLRGLKQAPAFEETGTNREQLHTVILVLNIININIKIIDNLLL